MIFFLLSLDPVAMVDGAEVISLNDGDPLESPQVNAISLVQEGEGKDVISIMAGRIKSKLRLDEHEILGERNLAMNEIQQKAKAAEHMAKAQIEARKRSMRPSQYEAPDAEDQNVQDLLVAQQKSHLRKQEIGMAMAVSKINAKGSDDLGESQNEAPRSVVQKAVESESPVQIYRLLSRQKTMLRLKMLEKQKEVTFHRKQAIANNVELGESQQNVNTAASHKKNVFRTSQ